MVKRLSATESRLSQNIAYFHKIIYMPIVIRLSSCHFAVLGT